MHAHPLIAMRKTSHDGIDVTSITSGIENEIKKAGTKIKKSSKKRKVQNFSLEFEENIIEPLLQIDNEKPEISSRSAKYLLNKTKTDSSFEPTNKSSENSALSANSISTPVSSTSKINNTPYISGTAPLHNHMNTNIFGMYDVSKDIATTKNSILVEIDGSKSGGYNPSPLIFTTAKIHTDSKSKLMEPVQVTPVPILSTIEGNIVRTFPDNSEHLMSSSSTRPIDLNINKCGISVMSESNESEKKYITELQKIHSLKDSTSSQIKNQNISKLSNKSIKTGNLPTSTNSVYSTTKTIKDEICIDSSTILKSSIDSAPITNKVAKETSEESIKDTLLAQNSMTTANSINNGISGENKALKPNMQFPLDIHVTDNKSKKLKSPNALCDMKENVTSARKYSPLCIIIEKHEQMSKRLKLLESSNDVATTAKVSSSGSKRLQRQKNASIEDTNETVTISNTLTNKNNKSQELDKNNIIKTEKASFDKGDSKNEDISPNEKTSISSKSTTIAETSTAVSSPLSIVSLVDPITKQEKMSPTDVEKLRPLTGSGVEDCSKILNKSSSVIPVIKAKDDIKPLSITTEEPLSNVTASSVMATFSKSDSLNLVPTSSKDDVLVKYESSVETTTLPSYIVSTSRTKIGSTLTFNTITTTSKSLTQKPLDEVVYTTNGKEKKSTASEQSNKTMVGMPSNLTRSNNGSKQTKTKIDSSVKDGRA
ncbi:uncharacterized protein LOC113397238 isoform X1 [Vanessa tameamea]|uniref:Uncharacterized protein LOC113397238 isoform X1 n=1 Tax=Vanessa tameamea TaxID=334116 RepID=A0A8B8I597_VANTA